MLNRTDISTFSLDILRRDKRQTFSRDFSEGDEDKVKKFLHWVNGWLPENKELIKPNLKKLYNALPQYNHLWEMVQLD